MQFSSKTAVITGGSRGLGANMALHLAKAGADIVITYNNNADMAAEVVSQIKALGRKAYALRFAAQTPAHIPQFVAELKEVLLKEFDSEYFDFLINNAGMGATIPFFQATEEQFDDFMNVHFKSVFFLTQKLAPMIRDNGRIINVSSGTTRYCNPGYSIYASMKAGVEVLTKYMAKDFGPRGITVNVLAPGAVETDFNNAAVRSNPELQARIAAFTALGRTGQPDDIGGIIVLLCSAESYWITGQRIEASGGVHL